MLCAMAEPGEFGRRAGHAAYETSASEIASRAEQRGRMRLRREVVGAFTTERRFGSCRAVAFRVWVIGPLIYRCASRWGLFFLVSCRVWFSVPRPLVRFSGLPTSLLRPGSNCLLPWAACTAPRGGSLLAMVLASLPATEGMW